MSGREAYRPAFDLVGREQGRTQLDGVGANASGHGKGR